MPINDAGPRHSGTDDGGGAAKAPSPVRSATEAKDAAEGVGRTASSDAIVDKFRRLASTAEVATMFAHELNQPLSAASNYVSLARQIAADQPVAALRDALDKASAQLMRAGQIIGCLRDVVTRAEPNRTEQSLHALIRRAFDLVAPAARERGVAVTLQLDAAEDEVLADPVQIEQALVSLMRDGVDAMHRSETRELTLSTALDGGAIRTEVTGAGCGRAAGLSIWRSIVEAHYGSSWADAAPDGGARFCFTLPLARTERAEFAG